ncbi:hypothetical protein [Paenibacillus sp. FSL R10-2736]|uniref:hypothetical protein n=1 Tax=Paenibacillus sp. FSL R10-2736 TaxID=2954692 RepID=UPI0030F8E87E
MKKTVFIMMGIILLLFTACNKKDSNRIQDDERAAAEYVNSLGYKIIVNEGETSRYTLSREMFSDLSYMKLWAVQQTEPESYLGKETVTYDFIVSGHPLEKKFASIYKQNNYDTSVMVMFADGKVIGGGSTPKSKNKLIVMTGGYYALNGDSLEEVTNMSYSEWLEEWKQKYAN